MRLQLVVVVSLLGMLGSACALLDPSEYGHRTGEHKSLVVGLDAARSVLDAELGRIFDEYEAVSERVSVTRCEPFESYKGAYSVRVVVSGVTSSEAYSVLIDGQPGLNEVAIEGSPSKSAGFEVDGVAGTITVTDRADSDLRVAANTGCYEEDAWGVEDPLSLEFERP
jgi:hypothetical protein